MSFEEWCEEFASHLGDRDDAKWMREEIFAKATWMMLNKKINKLEKQLKEADRLILEAKRVFAPNTTNSDADEYIDKYIKNKEKK